MKLVAENCIFREINRSPGRDATAFIFGTEELVSLALLLPLRPALVYV